MLEYKFEKLCPHPEVEKAHKNAGHPYTQTVHDRVFDIWVKTVNKKEPVQVIVNQIIRVSRQGKEYLVWDAELRGRDRKGNDLSFDHRFGTYEMPRFRKEVDERTDEIKSIEVAGYDTIYDQPFGKQLLDSLLENSKEHVSLIIKSTGRNYSVDTIEDFIEGTKDELVQSSKEGKPLAVVRQSRKQVQNKQV